MFPLVFHARDYTCISIFLTTGILFIIWGAFQCQHFVNVYFVKILWIRIRQSFKMPKFLVLRYMLKGQRSRWLLMSWSWNRRYYSRNDVPMGLQYRWMDSSLNSDCSQLQHGMLDKARVKLQSFKYLSEAKWTYSSDFQALVCLVSGIEMYQNNIINVRDLSYYKKQMQSRAMLRWLSYQRDK